MDGFVLVKNILKIGFMKKIQLWFRQSRLTRRIACWYFYNFLAQDKDLDSYLLWQLGYKWR